MRRIRPLWLTVLLWLAGGPMASAQVITPPTLLTTQSASVCATANAFAAANIGNAASLSFGVTGTWSGTLTFYGTTDGSTWVAIQVTNLASGTTPVTTATANGNFGLSNPGLLSVCVDFTTRASGTAVVTVTRGWSARGGGASSSGGIATPVTIANGGTGTGSTLTGIVRGSASAYTAAELSGDATTSGSNAVTVVKVNGGTPGGTCTNQAVTAISTAVAPTCTTLTSAYKDTSIASTGVDINTSYQVTATHLSAALPVNQGGTGAATLTLNSALLGNGTSAPLMIAPSTAGNLLTSDGTTWASTAPALPLSTSARVTTQYDSTGTTLTNIPGLTLTLTAGKTYLIDAFLDCTVDVTGGFKVGLGGTATATTIGGNLIYNTNAGSSTTNHVTSITQLITAAGGTIVGITLHIGIVVNAGGTLTVQFAQNTATGTSSVLVLSSFMKALQVT